MNAVVGIAQGGGACRIGSDEVALDEDAGGAADWDLHTVAAVAGDHVAGPGSGSSYGGGGSSDVGAVSTVAQLHRATRVGADVVPLDDVAGETAREDIHTVIAVA